MKKGQIYEGIVEKVKFPNKGIVNTAEGQAVVKNVVPGQKISFLVKKVRKGKAEGRLTEVLEKAPAELTEPNCPHFGICGGCNYQNLPYEEQLRLKTGQVLELLEPVVPNAAEIFEGIKESPLPFGYRNKMEFTFGDEEKDGPLALGMHRRGSFYDIVTVSGCRIVDADYRKILTETANYFRERQIPFYHRMRHTGYLRHLLVRKAAKTGEILIDLITTTQTICSGDGKTGGQEDFSHNESLSVQTDLPAGGGSDANGASRAEQKESAWNAAEKELLNGWMERLLSLPLEGSVTGILHTRNDSVSDAVKNEGTDILYGRDFFYEELLGLKFKISPFSFFQTNSLGAEVLYETARAFIGDALGAKDQVVFDLYSGTGTIAQMLAPVARKVIGVEIVGEAVEAARENAALNGLSNCEFIAGDVLKVLDGIEEKPDFIVLDPPRDGIHPKALKKIIAYGVKRMLYISCKPTSLQRDLEVLQESGYRAERICCVDMFPGTVHVETVCLLSKLNAEHHIEVELTMDEMDLTTAESKATYEEIKNYVKEKTGLQVSNLYIAQIKRKCGIIERINYNLPKSETSRQPKCPPEKETAIIDALKHFQMI